MLVSTLYEHGAVINPVALERIIHFNVLKTMQPKQRTQGLQHVVITTLQKQPESIQLDSGLKFDQAAAKTNIGDHQPNAQYPCH